MKILFTGGGSYGHVSPIVCIFPYLKNHSKYTDFCWIGSARFEESAAEDLGIPYVYLKTAKVRRYMSWKNFTDIFVLVFSLLRAFTLLKKIKPDIIFSTGGYVSVPVVLIGKVLGIKIIIHEQTVAFGLANKVGAYVADTILLSDEGSVKFLRPDKRKVAHIVGNPINRRYVVPSRIEDHLSFADQNKKLLYITGGSQGSQKVNEAIFAILPKLQEDFNIIHQCGTHDFVKAKEYEKQYSSFYIAEDFIGPELPAIYQHAALAIARAGANTVNELDAFGIPTIFIPLQPCNNDEQYKNAVKFLTKNKGAIIKQDELGNSTHLLNSINSLKNEIRLVPRGNNAATEIVRYIDLLTS